MIVAPTAPSAGLKLAIDGVGSTRKSLKLTKLTPFVVNDIFPVVAPTGTVVLMVVVFEEPTVAACPLKVRLVMVPKFEPVIVTATVAAPLDGVKPPKVGVAKTIKSVALTKLTPLVVNEIFPVEAPVGTVVVMDDPSAENTG